MLLNSFNVGLKIWSFIKKYSPVGDLFFILLLPVNGSATLQEVRYTLNRVIGVHAPAGQPPQKPWERECLPGSLSWSRHFTLTKLLSALVYKLVLRINPEKTLKLINIPSHWRSLLCNWNCQWLMPGWPLGLHADLHYSTSVVCLPMWYKIKLRY